MYYTIYKITNQINGKFYVGSHKTKDLNDSYMGSGKLLLLAQEKYGIENFKKEILFVFETAEEMYAKETELVNEDFLAEENTYNLKIGGFGGWDYINDTRKNIYGKNGQSGYGKENLAPPLWSRTDLSSEQLSSIKNKISKSLKRKYESGELIPTFKGKTHTLETKKTIGEKNSKRQLGSGNSQYGTCWVWCQEFGNKKIKKEMLDTYLTSGWSKTYKPGYKPENII